MAKLLNCAVYRYNKKRFRDLAIRNLAIHMLSAGQYRSMDPAVLLMLLVQFT